MHNFKVCNILYTVGVQMYIIHVTVYMCKCKSKCKSNQMTIIKYICEKHQALIHRGTTFPLIRRKVRLNRAMAQSVD